MLNDLDHQHFQEVLLTLQSNLLAVEQSGQEAAQTVELDQTTIGRVSRMDALQGQAMAKESQQRRTVQLQRIEASLQRLEKGTFGLCLRCGEEIHVKRLAFDPTAPLCIDCAKQGNKG
ncbi:MAG: TraR/DksA family transcriptional regulator [Nitrospirales bacterium]|nr:MAG: TraR/DksA family transcriptional regulator [Nitrospirales bacterium]